MRNLLTGPVAKGFAGAVIGGIFFLMGIHLYSDHAALHALVDLVNRQAQQAPPQ